MEWSDVLWILIFVVGVALFLGPGMWSSSTNTLAKDLWLKWRARRAKKTSATEGSPPPTSGTKDDSDPS